MRALRILPVLAAAACLSAGLSACTATSYAAVVNGSVISQHELDHTISEYAQNGAYLAEQSSSGASATVNGTGTDTWNTGFADGVLEQMIGSTLVTQAAQHLRVTASADQAALAESDAEQAVGGAQIFEGFPADFRQSLVDEYGLLAAIEAQTGGIDISTPALERYYAAHVSDFATTCTDDAVFTTSAAASAFVTELRTRHLSFTSAEATLPASVQHGPLLCGTSTEYTTEVGAATASAIAALAVGGVTAPFAVQGNGGEVWVLVSVTSRTPQAFSTVEPEVRQTVLAGAQTSFGNYYRGLLNSANIELNPTYGELVSQDGSRSLKPPTGPPTAALGSLVPSS